MQWKNVSVRCIQGFFISLFFCQASSYCLPGGTCWPSRDAIASLATLMEGPLINQSHPKYLQSGFLMNMYFTSTYPALIALVHSSSDVRNCLSFVQRYNIKLTIYSCGHEYAGGRSSANNSFQINFSEMSAVTLNLKDRKSKTGYSVTAQSGAKWKKVYEKVTEYRKQVVGGGCNEVCVAGFTLGGGESILSRSYGLAVDNVVSFQMVLYNGSIATCHKDRTILLHRNGTKRHSRDADLFWAVRGGGGGTFGVLLSLTFVIHDAPSHIVLYNTNYMIGDVEDENRQLISGIFNYLSRLPKQWGVYVLFPVKAGDGISKRLTLIMLHNGPWYWDSVLAIQPLHSFRTDRRDFAQFKNFTDVYHFLSEVMTFGDSVNEISVSANIRLNVSDPKLLNFFSRDILYERNVGTDIQCPMTLIAGQVSQFSPQSAAITSEFRAAHMTASCGINWQEDDVRELVEEEIAFLDCKLHALSRSSYFNEAACFAGSWKERLWGEHYERLLLIKKKYDPNNVFTCKKCIGSDLQV